MSKKEEYKFLTNEMRENLDKEIFIQGKDALYDKVKYNINVSRVAELQNEPGAFDKCYRGGCEYIYEYKFYYTPVILEPHSSMEQEMMYYIDKERYASGDVPHFKVDM